MANEIEKNNGEIIIYQSEDGKIKLSLAEKLVDILTFVADKDQITTEEIVSHFNSIPLQPSVTFASSQSSVIWRHMAGIRIGLLCLSSSRPFFYRTSGGRTNNAASAIFFSF